MERRTLTNITNVRFSEINQYSNSKQSLSSKISLNSRTSSMGLTKNGNKKTDPRPIGQSNYTSKCIKDIVSYLSFSSTNFDKELGQKLLKSPMTRDYLQIMDILMKKIDPNFKAFSSALVEKKKGQQTPTFDMEIIIHLFDFLGYPFPINKRNLVSIGAPHAWPSVLASIHWLCELTRYQDATSEQDSSFENDEAKQFFTYLGKSYKSFLQCENTDYMVMEDELRKLFAEKDKLIIQEIENIVNEISQLEREQAYESPLPILDKKKQECEEEIEKLKKLLVVREESKKKLEDSFQQNEKESMMISNQIQKIQFENELLKKQIQQQEIKPEEAKRMYSELHRLEDTFSILSQRYEECKVKDWENDTKLKKDTELIYSTIQSFNRLVGNEKYMIDVNNIDIGNLSNKLKTYYHELISKLRKEQEENISLREVLEKNEWERQELIDLKNQLSGKLNRLESGFKQEKEQWRNDLQQQLHVIETLENENRQLKMIEQNDQELKNSFNEIDKYSLEIDNRSVKYSKEEKAITDILFKTLELMTEHKERIQKTLQVVQDKLKNQFQ